MNYHPTTTFRIPKEIKNQAASNLNEMGISMSAAVNAFLTVIAKTGRIPFELDINQHKLENINTKMKQNKSGNATLNLAFKAKKDQFYTQLTDIEKEIANYKTQFKDKNVLCNCDDPLESAFFKYFAKNFNSLGLTSLRTISYRTSPLAEQEYPLDYGDRPYSTYIHRMPEDDVMLPDGSLDLERVFSVEGNKIEWLLEDGDFRSKESQLFLEQADIVVTNPPFSLFREFITLLTQYKKQYLVLGNMNASTCREIFPLFMKNKVWYGESIRSGDRKFHVPEDYPLNATNCGVDDFGKKFVRVKGIRWFTNLENDRHHEELTLSKDYNEASYPKYDNYEAIEVSKTKDIPRDYDGIMGVPITFLDRFNPEQFEILMLANGNTRTNVNPSILRLAGYKPNKEDKGGVAMLNGKRTYARILIRKKVQ